MIPATGETRYIPTGDERFCAWCHKSGEPLADCWHPLTDEFWPIIHRNQTRVAHYSDKCLACKSEMKKQEKLRAKLREAA